VIQVSKGEKDKKISICILLKKTSLIIYFMVDIYIIFELIKVEDNLLW